MGTYLTDYSNELRSRKIVHVRVRAFTIYKAFLLTCGKRPYKWATQWDSNSLLKVCLSSLLNILLPNSHECCIVCVTLQLISLSLSHSLLFLSQYPSLFLSLILPLSISLFLSGWACVLVVPPNTHLILSSDCLKTKTGSFIHKRTTPTVARRQTPTNSKH